MIPLTEGLVTTAEDFWFGGTDCKAWSHEAHSMLGDSNLVPEAEVESTWLSVTRLKLERPVYVRVWSVLYAGSKDLDLSASRFVFSSICFSEYWFHELLCKKMFCDQVSLENVTSCSLLSGLHNTHLVRISLTWTPFYRATDTPQSCWPADYTWGILKVALAKPGTRLLLEQECKMTRFSSSFKKDRFLAVHVWQRCGCWTKLGRNWWQEAKRWQNMGKRDPTKRLP